MKSAEHWNSWYHADEARSFEELVRAIQLDALDDAAQAARDEYESNKGCDPYCCEIISMNFRDRICGLAENLRRVLKQ